MHAVIPYALHFSNCHFAVNVSMSNMECAALYLDGSCLAQGLDADRLKTKGNVHLRNGFCAKGEVLLTGANIGGNLDCKDGKFINPNERALVADGVATRGSVYLRHGFPPRAKCVCRVRTLLEISIVSAEILTIREEMRFSPME